MRGESKDRLAGPGRAGSIPGRECSGFNQLTVIVRFIPAHAGGQSSRDFPFSAIGLSSPTWGA